ncbi:DEAD/DEAH box helicase [Candidatus Gracilibacteria bacterium]|nr:DEAD/DEAH box helicase [Candidatus Gracilibacteria bacterium]
MYNRGSNKGSFGGRPFPRSRRPSRSGSRGGRSDGKIDISKLVSKAVKPENIEVFVPQYSFRDFPFDEQLQLNIEKKGYSQTTPIQDKSIPVILQGRDVVGIANTGTGKTAAFLLPLIDKVLKDRTQNVLIMVPTRELAVQIQDEFVGFTRSLKLYSAVCVGGMSIGNQIRAIRGKPNFIIATPGRLKDLIDRRVLSLDRCQNVVLDEADRMLDMGFINDITALLAMMPAERHSLFFSATVSATVHRLIHRFLRNPETISVKSRDTSQNVDQDVIRVRFPTKKMDLLQEMLTQKDFNKVLIFGRTKHGVEKISIMLAAKGFKVASIHGDKTQGHRQRALDMFKRNAIQILVATDVAARGLDISEVSHVINYDMPATYEDYIHRIGRTGRADKKGKALTFVE